jgi:hypothetical protein
VRILGLGIQHGSGLRLFDPIDGQMFAEAIERGLFQNSAQLDQLTALTRSRTNLFREEMRRPPVDLSDPRAAGWTFLVSSRDPRRGEIIEGMQRLARHRGMDDPTQPLTLDDDDDWFDWIQDRYIGTGMERPRPHHVLIVGDPAAIPFGFQAALQAVASVGRLDFDTAEELASYVTKVLAIETASGPVAERDVLMFGPDAGIEDATWYSREYLVKPLMRFVVGDLGIATRALLASQATKQAFLESIRNSRPALVFTASHGMAAPDASLPIQKRVTGGICCRREAGAPESDWLITADDVPEGDPFLEGAVLFQFACFGYGTPAESDYAHWLPDTNWMPRKIAQRSFVSALPKRLLAHPRGPIAFVGHVDAAWLHGFDDPAQPHPIEPWSRRIVPFKSAVEQILRIQAIGTALRDMNNRYVIENGRLASFLDSYQRHPEAITKNRSKLSDAFIFRGDAQNYMVLGDPAVHLRIPNASL